MKQILIFIFLSSFVVYSSSASSEENEQLQWQLTIGGFWLDAEFPRLTGIKSTRKGLNLLADARIQYKRFYLNTHSGDFFGGSNVGYQLITKDDWGIDAVYGNYQMSFNQRGYFNNKSPSQALKTIEKRKSDHSFGLAYYREVGSFQTVAELTYDLLGESKGWLLHLEATNNYELKNWDIWLNFGLKFYSSNFIDYYYGVDKNEANEFLPSYQIDSGASAFTQLQANYPIAENWVFSAGASVLVLTSNTKNSPLLESRHARILFTGVKYVF